MPLTLKDASGADVQVPTSEEIAEMITGATRSQIEKATKKLAGDLTKSSSDAMLEALKAYEEKRSESAPPAAGGEKKADPELAAMKRQLEEQGKILEIERKARVEAETSRRQESARTQVLSQIDGVVRPELKEFLQDYLYHRVEFDESGTPLIKVGGDEALPLKDGIASFLKSKEAGAFIPVQPPGGKPGAGGKPPPNGQRPGGLPSYDKPAATDEEKIRRAMEREAALLAATAGNT